MTQLKFTLLFFTAAIAVFSQKKPAEKMPIYKSLGDSCFYAGDVILTSFLTRTKTATEIKPEALNEVTKFLQKHKNLVAEIKFRKKSTLQKNTFTEIQSKLLSEPSLGNITFVFMDPNDNPDYLGPHTGKVRAIAVAKEGEEIKTEIKILSPKIFPYKNPRKERFAAEFFPGDIINMHAIYFELGKAGLRPETKDSLKKWVTFIKEHPDLIFQVVSHSDSRGNKKYNTDLTSRRAQCCLDYMIKEAGAPAERLSSKGYGASQLLVDDNEILKKSSPEEKETLHSQNRRIELRILGYTGDCVTLFCF